MASLLQIRTWTVLLFATFAFSSCQQHNESAPAVTVPMLTVIAANESAQLSWTSAAASMSYTILRGTTSGTYLPIATGITGTSYTDQSLQNGTWYYYAVQTVSNGNTVNSSNECAVVPLQGEAAGSVLWPLSKSSAPDADGVRYPQGPRLLSDYDFHAGVDIPAAKGTSIFPVLDGVVTKIQPWDNVSTGSGNYVLVKHDHFKWTAYQHMNDFAPGLAVGQVVKAGQTLLGHVGSSGASFDHLHFNYMVGLTSESTDERKAHNPLELLPHTNPSTIAATFRKDGSNKIDIDLFTHQMTIRWIALYGNGKSCVADYYQILSEGSIARNSQTQSGIYFEVSELPEPAPAAKLKFTLTVSPSPAFTVDRIVLIDFDGSVMLDARK